MSILTPKGGRGAARSSAARSSPQILDVVVLEAGADWDGWNESRLHHTDLLTLAQAGAETAGTFLERVRRALGRLDRDERIVRTGTFVPGPQIRAEIAGARLLLALALAGRLDVGGGGVLVLDDRKASAEARRSMEVIAGLVGVVGHEDVEVVLASRESTIEAACQGAILPHRTGTPHPLSRSGAA